MGLVGLRRSLPRYVYDGPLGSSLDWLRELYASVEPARLNVAPQTRFERLRYVGKHIWRYGIKKDGNTIDLRARDFLNVVRPGIIRTHLSHYRRPQPNLSLLYRQIEKMDNVYASCPPHPYETGESYRLRLYSQCLDERHLTLLAHDIDARWHMSGGIERRCRSASVPDFDHNRTNLDSSAGCMPGTPKNLRKEDVIRDERVAAARMWLSICNGDGWGEVHYWKVIARSKVLDLREATEEACRLMLAPRCAMAEVGHAVDQPWSDIAARLHHKLPSAIGWSQFGRGPEIRLAYFGMSYGEERLPLRRGRRL